MVRDRIRDATDFFDDMVKPGFRGLWMFRSMLSYYEWMGTYQHTLIKAGGTFHRPDMRWDFPWGAVCYLSLQSIEEDVKKIRGLEITNLMYDSYCPPGNIMCAKIRLRKLT